MLSFIIMMIGAYCLYLGSKHTVYLTLAFTFIFLAFYLWQKWF